MSDPQNNDHPQITRQRGTRSGQQRTRRAKNENSTAENHYEIPKDSPPDAKNHEAIDQEHNIPDVVIPVEPVVPKEPGSGRSRAPRSRNLKKQLVEKDSCPAIDVKPPPDPPNETTCQVHVIQEKDSNEVLEPHKDVKIEIPPESTRRNDLQISPSEAEFIQTREDNPTPAVLIRNSSSIFNDYGNKITYQVSCEKHAFSSKRSYQLVLDGKVLMSAKSKGFPTNKVYIQNKEECHFKDASFDYVMDYKINYKGYYLYEHNVDSNKIMSIDVTEITEPIHYPRIFNVWFSDSQGTYTISSLLPTKKPNGAYVLQFGPTFIRESIKNTVLIDNNGIRKIMIRRISDDRLEVDVLNNIKIGKETLFALGIAAWICPL